MMGMTRTDPEWKDKIITGDETWVYGYDPETTPQSAEWRGHTVIKEMYLGILRRLREAIRKKRPEKWTNGGWILHHDNARPHTAHLMTSFLAKNGTQILLQPPYFPDIAPNDFFLFPKLKAVLKGRHFDTRDDIIEKSPLALKSIPKETYKKLFRQLGETMALALNSYALARSLAAPKDLAHVDYEEILNILTGHFCPKPNVIVQRYHFNKHNQGNESIASYVAELRRLSENCEFIDLDDRLRDRLVCGLRKVSLVKRLLSETVLTLEKAINIALCDESASANASVLMEATPDVNILKKANKGDPFNFKSKSKLNSIEFRKD
ncbi:hypothetical protein LAZ67_17000926 [Cordylochernes scorpioides]|uniref:Transposase n=1 Tax=Cordylochernes scorpioides TaxID=51811 RepID=A0ABY6LD04_9ARAC|nr:hypothetical protein LAZ67_17000926 [Cordylochernes scorpioides]